MPEDGSQRRRVNLPGQGEQSIPDLDLDLDGLFPDELEEVAKVLMTLAEYANHKAVAMRYRAAGEITAALSEENVCDGYYQALPPWARW